MSDKVLEIVEAARKTGSIKKGTNEVTKALERGEAEFVAIAQDVSPKELMMHLPILADEKGIKHGEVKSKEELGAAAGLPVDTVAVAVTEPGEAKSTIKSYKQKKD